MLTMYVKSMWVHLHTRTNSAIRMHLRNIVRTVKAFRHILERLASSLRASYNDLTRARTFPVRLHFRKMYALVKCDASAAIRAGGSCAGMDPLQYCWLDARRASREQSNFSFPMPLDF